MVEALQLGLDLFTNKAQAVVGMHRVRSWGKKGRGRERVRDFRERRRAGKGGGRGERLATIYMSLLLGLSGTPQKKKELVAEQVHHNKSVINMCFLIHVHV